MFKRSWVSLLLLFLPLLGGIIAFILVTVFSQSFPPFMVTADFGFLALVFGMTIRNLGVIALMLGLFITGVLLILYNRSLRRQDRTQMLIEQAELQAEQG